jgi:hypothetical protein
MLQCVDGSVFLGFLNAVKSFWNHFASVGCVKVLNSKGGGYVFSLKLRRELMLKVIDLFCDLSVENSRGSVSKTFANGYSLVSSYLIMKMLKLMNCLIKEVKRSEACSLLINLYVII